MYIRSKYTDAIWSLQMWHANKVRLLLFRRYIAFVADTALSNNLTN